MGGKPKLDQLVQKIKEKPARERKRTRTHKPDLSDSLDVEMIRKWVPHLVACDFNRYRSLQLAFPTHNHSDGSLRKLSHTLITHPMFTDTMAAHLDTIDNKFGNSERYVLDKMYRQAEANIFDYFECDEHGQLKMRKLSELPKWQQQNVKKLKINNKIAEQGLDRRLIDQTVELEIVDAFKPVQALGRNLGMFVERVEIDFGKQTADRLQEALERVRRKRLESNGHQQPEDQPGAARTLN